MLSDLKTEMETRVATRSLFVKFRLFAGDFLGESPVLFLFTEQFSCVEWNMQHIFVACVFWVCVFLILQCFCMFFSN